MQAKRTSRKDAAIEIGVDFTLDEASNWVSLFARVREKGLQILSDDFVEKRLVRLVALLVDGWGSSADRARCPDEHDPCRARCGVGRFVEVLEPLP
jgi:hypothetical protein